jgi:aspartate-semialdehyde dehydrogenase
MGFKVAVVGATGNVGREMLNILEERGFPADEVAALASRRSQGTEVSYGDRTLKVRALDNYDFSDTDICVMSAGGAVSKEWSPRIGRQGCVVIDNSSAWRYDQDVPLVVPEVNPDAIAGFTRKNIIANPNCSTARRSSASWWPPISLCRAPARRAWTSSSSRPAPSSSPTR